MCYGISCHRYRYSLIAHSAPRIIAIPKPIIVMMKPAVAKNIFNAFMLFFLLLSILRSGCKMLRACFCFICLQESFCKNLNFILNRIRNTSTFPNRNRPFSPVKLFCDIDLFAAAVSNKLLKSHFEVVRQSSSQKFNSFNFFCLLN